MAYDAFLKLDGIDGEVRTATGYEKWIEVFSFSWGASQVRHQRHRWRRRSREGLVPGPPLHVKPDRQVVGAAVPEVRAPESTSRPRMLDAAEGGRRRHRRVGGFLKIKLEDVLVSSVSVRRARAGRRPAAEDVISLNFVKIDYAVHAPDGSTVDIGMGPRANSDRALADDGRAAASAPPAPPSGALADVAAFRAALDAAGFTTASVADGARAPTTSSSSRRRTRSRCTSGGSRRRRRRSRRSSACSCSTCRSTRTTSTARFPAAAQTASCGLGLAAEEDGVLRGMVHLVPHDESPRSPPTGPASAVPITSRASTGRRRRSSQPHRPAAGRERARRRAPATGSRRSRRARHADASSRPT